MKNQSRNQRKTPPEVGTYFVHTANTDDLPVPSNLLEGGRASGNENLASPDTEGTLKTGELASPQIPPIKEIRRQMAANKLTGWQREDIHYDKPETWPKRSRLWPQL